MGKRIIKCSATQRRTHEGKHRFEHWYVDNQVYFITARCAGKYPAFATGETSAVFWDRFDYYTAKYLFTPWVTSLVATHYHLLGYCKDGKILGQLMRRIHGSVAKLVKGHRSALAFGGKPPVYSRGAKWGVGRASACQAHGHFAPGEYTWGFSTDMCAFAAGAKYPR